MESIVTYHATKVSPQEVQRKAEEQYAGGYFCCEAVMSVIMTLSRLMFRSPLLPCLPVCLSEQVVPAVCAEL